MEKGDLKAAIAWVYKAIALNANFAVSGRNPTRRLPSSKSRSLANRFSGAEHPLFHRC